jgi:hypothetical protein
MNSPSPAAPSKSRGERWGVGVLLVLLLVAAFAGGWMILRSERARSEEGAQFEAAHTLPTKNDDAVAAGALANYLAKIQAQFREHEASFTRVQQQKALSWNIHEREDIERDRKIIRDFLATNARVSDTLRNGEGFIRAELETAKVPATARESALALYTKTEGPLLPLQMRVRDCDQAIGENALAVLDLLDFNWGEWSRDEATGQMNFTNSVTLETFRDYVGKIAAAATERKAAEDELEKKGRKL